jgi:2-dehydropantoate 2-reductase
MRYVVIGAGAVGGTIGGRLALAGREVVLVARGAHAQALKADGLTLVTPEGTHQLPIPAADGVAELALRPDDVLLLTVKTQDSEAVLAQLANLTRSDGRSARSLPVVCAQNGVASERMALRRFERVYGVAVYLPGAHLRPGVVGAAGAPLSGLLDIGRYPKAADGRADDIAEAVAADLRASHFESTVRPDIMRWKYAKLIGNVGNAINALGDNGPGCAELGDATRAEARVALRAAGIDWRPDEDITDGRRELVLVQAIEGHVGSGSSSRQSLARGVGSIEADYLNGEISLLGRLHGVATPVNDGLARIANRAARDHIAPNSFTAQQLRDEIERTPASGG